MKWSKQTYSSYLIPISIDTLKCIEYNFSFSFFLLNFNMNEDFFCNSKIGSMSYRLICVVYVCIGDKSVFLSIHLGTSTFQFIKLKSILLFYSCCCCFRCLCHLLMSIWLVWYMWIPWLMVFSLKTMTVSNSNEHSNKQSYWLVNAEGNYKYLVT